VVTRGLLPPGSPAPRGESSRLVRRHGVGVPTLVVREVAQELPGVGRVREVVELSIGHAPTTVLRSESRHDDDVQRHRGDVDLPPERPCSSIDHAEVQDLAAKNDAPRDDGAGQVLEQQLAELVVAEVTKALEGELLETRHEAGESEHDVPFLRCRPHLDLVERGDLYSHYSIKYIKSQFKLQILHKLQARGDRRALGLGNRM